MMTHEKGEQRSLKAEGVRERRALDRFPAERLGDGERGPIALATFRWLRIQQARGDFVV